MIEVDHQSPCLSLDLTFLTLIYLSIAIVDPNSILVRHKKFLKQLERQKNVERDDAYNAANEKENKTRAFKEQA